jgi:hypothetical protein
LRRQVYGDLPSDKDSTDAMAGAVLNPAPGCKVGGGEFLSSAFENAIEVFSGGQ